MTVRRMDNVLMVVDYKDIYRLCYIRGPEGILVGLAQELGSGGAGAARSGARATRLETAILGP